MVCALILAGGSGTRMGISALPKQFLSIGKKPIIIHTIEQFMMVKEINHLIVVVSKDFKNHLENILKQYGIKNVHIVTGGKDRHDSVVNGCKYIKEVLKAEDAVVISHDSVRPFITRRIIEDNIEAIKHNDVVDTIIPATDTIVEGSNNVITNIPDRKKMFQGQTPQTFKLNEFLSLSETLTEEEQNILTDVCKLYYLRNKKVGYVDGEVFNFKITTKFDLNIANGFVKGDFEL